MATYWCEDNGAGAVSRVVVCADSGASEFLAGLGGTWVQTVDPYSANDPTLYAGIGDATKYVQPDIVAGGTVFDTGPNNTKLVDTSEYTTWPFSNLHYDSANSKLWLLYMSGSDHIDNTTTGVFYVEIDTTTETGGTPVEIIPPNGTPLGAVCHCSFIASNGDYVAMIVRRNASQQVIGGEQWRSTNAGSTWSNEGAPNDGVGDIDMSDLEPTGSIVTSTGRVIIGAWDRVAEELQMMVSDDDGATWTVQSAITNNVADTNPLEPAFCQIPSGTYAGRIIAIIRQGLSASDTTPLFTYSDDNGDTWAALTLLDTRINQYSNPAAILVHPDDAVIEVICGTRESGRDNLYRMCATYDNAAVGEFGGQQSLNVESQPTNDFGYPAAARVGSKVFLCWYSGGDTDSDIYMAVGTRP